MRPEASPRLPALKAQLRSCALRSKPLLFLLIFLAALSHMGLVALYVLPDNPVRVALWPVERRLVGSFFDQRWGMFAPAPLSTTQTLCVRCRQGDEITAWIDATTPMTRGVRRSFLSPDLDVATYLMNMIAWDVTLEARSSSVATDALRGAAPIPEEREDMNLRWARIGSIACADAFLGRGFDGVEMKYRERPETPWSARGAAPARPKDHVIGTFEFVPGLIRPGLFAAGGRECSR